MGLVTGPMAPCIDQDEPVVIAQGLDIAELVPALQTIAAAVLKHQRGPLALHLVWIRTPWLLADGIAVTSCSSPSRGHARVVSQPSKRWSPQARIHGCRQGHHPFLYPALLDDLPHGLHIHLLNALIRDLRIPLAGGDRGIPEQLPYGDNLGPLLEQVGGKGVP